MEKQEENILENKFKIEPIFENQENDLNITAAEPSKKLFKCHVCEKTFL